jgi:hypothetical protein
MEKMKTLRTNTACPGIHKEAGGNDVAPGLGLS